MIIYNLFPLLAGPAPNWKKHFSRAAAMGFDWIFINPIQLPGGSSSLYSIADYYTINPLFVAPRSKKGAEEQIKEAFKAAQGNGLKVMIDLVINHCAVDSKLLQSHPEWFSWEAKGRVLRPFCYENGKKVIWKDLATFDHKNTKDKEGLFQFFFNVIKFLIELGCRGFRCDAAYKVPGNIWKRLIRETKKIYPDVLFFAETLGCPPDQTRKTAAAGFDYIFNSSKWWDYNSHWLMAQYDLTRDIAPSISFPESHDTNRLYAELHGNIDGVKQRYLFAAIFSGGVMMPMGFEFGFEKKLHVVNTRLKDWEQTDVDLTSFITKVNKIKTEHAIFLEEAPTRVLHNANPHVLLMWKASVNSQDESLLILNKDIHNYQHFYADNLQEFVQAGAPLMDVSPEDQLEYIPKPFSYDLRPGQGIVLITSRDVVQDD